MDDWDLSRRSDRCRIAGSGAVFKWEFLGHTFYTEFQAYPAHPDTTPVVVMTPSDIPRPPELILHGFCQFLHILAGDIPNSSPSTSMLELAKGSIWVSASRTDVYHALASLFLTHGVLLKVDATTDSSDTGYLLTISSGQGHIRTFEEFIKTEGQKIQAMSRVLSHVSDSIINKAIKN